MNDDPLTSELAAWMQDKLDNGASMAEVSFAVLSTAAAVIASYDPPGRVKVLLALVLDIDKTAKDMDAIEMLDKTMEKMKGQP